MSSIRSFTRRPAVWSLPPQDSHLQDVADLTEGFSGREIAKLAIAWQAAAYGTSDSSFTADLMTEVLEVCACVRACCVCVLFYCFIFN